jgi:hypothetical protein
VRSTINTQAGRLAQVADDDGLSGQQQIAVQFRKVFVTQDQIAIRAATDKEGTARHLANPVSSSASHNLQFDTWKIREKMRMRRAVTVVRFQQLLH